MQLHFTGVDPAFQIFEPVPLHGRNGVHGVFFYDIHDILLAADDVSEPIISKTVSVCALAACYQ